MADAAGVERMLISVAICTWNRANLLDQTLEQMRRLQIEPGIEWELIVVNNNSTDNTDEILAKHNRLLPIVPIYENEQGLSHARNTAVASAKGDYIVWTDDDVLVSPNWIQSYVEAFKRWPEAAAWGGKVLPWYVEDPPQWLKRHIEKLGRYFALRDFGEEEYLLPKGENPFGANMAFRADILRKYAFNTQLGRRGNILISGEDSEVIEKIRKSGGQIVWVPGSQLEHYLPPERMSLKYLQSLQYSNGRFELGAIQTEGPSLLGVPTWVWRKYAGHYLRFLLGRVLAPESFYWIEHMLLTSNYSGRIAATRDRAGAASLL